MSSSKLSGFLGLALLAVLSIVALGSNAAEKIALPGVAAAGNCPMGNHEGPLGY